MHNSRRAEVAESLIPSPTKKDPPAARNGRPTASGMSAGATAATADEDGPVAPLSGETTPIKAEVRVPHPTELLALKVPSKWILEAAAATSRDQAQRTAGSVAQCELQTGDKELPEWGSPVEVQQRLLHEEAARKAGDKELPEWGSPVGVQQTLLQEEAARKAGDEELPERGSPVEVQQELHQEEAARETGDEELPEASSRGGCQGGWRRGASGVGEPCGGPADRCGRRDEAADHRGHGGRQRRRG